MCLSVCGKVQHAERQNISLTTILEGKIKAEDAGHWLTDAACYSVGCLRRILVLAQLLRAWDVKSCYVQRWFPVSSQANGLSFKMDSF